MIVGVFLLISCLVLGEKKANREYNSYMGLVMAGYQGWFNTPTDGANRGWHHWEKNGQFYPGMCTIDFWPDMREYPIQYETAFVNPDGSAATVYSPYDESSVRLHFQWMNEYGIDGVFLQRFIQEIQNDSGKNHFNKVMSSAFAASTEFNRAVCVMYDLSGMGSNAVGILLNDLAEIRARYDLPSRRIVPSYLFHNGKPLVVIWGIGFNDGRQYTYADIENMIDGCKNMGFSVMLGVPTYWRTLDRDTLPDPKLHDLIRKSDIIMPWLVGRFDRGGCGWVKDSIQADVIWCDQNRVDYAPLCFPGFSWLNMNPTSNPIQREKGGFIWDQMMNAISVGARALYIAMFDEVDEGTAIYKTCNRKDVPDNGAIQFQGIDNDLPTDHYLFLVGAAGEVLRGERPLSYTQPTRV